MGRKSASIRVGALLVAGLVGGGVVGSVLGGVSVFAYLAFVMPIVGALISGVWVAACIRWLRVPLPKVAAFIGLATGTALMVALLFVSLANERASIVHALETGQGVSQQTADRLLTEELNERTGGRDGSLSWLWLRIHSGVRITPTLQFDATSFGNGFILLVEWLLAMVIVLRSAMARANEPYCQPCGDWYTRRVLGMAPLGSLQSIRATLSDGQFHRLGRRLDAPEKTQEVAVHCRFCLHCDTQDIMLELEVTERGERTNLVTQVTAPYAALDDVLDSQALASGRVTDLA